MSWEIFPRLNEKSVMAIIEGNLLIIVKVSCPHGGSLGSHDPQFDAYVDIGIRYNEEGEQKYEQKHSNFIEL